MLAPYFQLEVKTWDRDGEEFFWKKNRTRKHSFHHIINNTVGGAPPAPPAAAIVKHPFHGKFGRKRKIF